jgi:uncharacterized protein DUF3500
MEIHRERGNSASRASRVECACCQDVGDGGQLARRDFLKTAAGVVVGAGAVATGLPLGRVWAEPKVVSAAGEAAEIAPPVAAMAGQPESLVKTLFETLSPKQRETICFAWDFQDSKRGLLRTRVANNWNITEPFVNSDFYTKDQQAIVRGIFEGIINPEWHERIDKQLYDDAGGYGEQNSIAIFGVPGSDEFEFVMTGRHMTIRADGNTGKHVAFGGPIFYGHAADGFNEGPTHPGNVFWPQAVAANKLFETLDGKQQEQALIRTGVPPESHVGFRGKEGPFQGIAVRDLSSDQREHLQSVVNLLLEPYRQGDQDEAEQCLKAQGGLEACHLAYYAQQDIGNDHVWDIWRLEGPSFVWHYRGAPHVHVWVNVADDASVKLNA